MLIVRKGPTLTNFEGPSVRKLTSTIGSFDMMSGEKRSLQDYQAALSVS